MTIPWALQDWSYLAEKEERLKKKQEKEANESNLRHRDRRPKPDEGVDSSS